MSEEHTLNDNEANVTRIVRAVCPNGRPMIVQAEYCDVRGVDLESLNVFPLFGDKVGERLPLDDESRYLAALGLAQVLDKFAEDNEQNEQNEQ